MEAEEKLEGEWGDQEHPEFSQEFPTPKGNGGISKPARAAGSKDYRIRVYLASLCDSSNPGSLEVGVYSIRGEGFSQAYQFLFEEKPRSNNLRAAYKTLLEAMMAVLKSCPKGRITAEFCFPEEGLLRQLEGSWKVRNPELQELRRRVEILEKHFHSVRYLCRNDEEMKALKAACREHLRSKLTEEEVGLGNEEKRAIEEKLPLLLNSLKGLSPGAAYFTAYSLFRVLGSRGKFRVKAKSSDLEKAYALAVEAVKKSFGGEPKSVKEEGVMYA